MNTTTPPQPTAGLPLLHRNGMPPLAVPRLAQLTGDCLVRVFKVENQLVLLDANIIKIWDRETHDRWTQSCAWKDEDDEATQVERMQLVDRTLVLALNNGQIQLWKAEKGAWKLEVTTSVVELGAELAKCNTRTAWQFALEHKYTIAAALAIALMGAYHIHSARQQANPESANAARSTQDAKATEVHSTTVDVTESYQEGVVVDMSEEELNIHLDNYGSLLSDSEDINGFPAVVTSDKTETVSLTPDQQKGQRYGKARLCNATTPDDLADVAKRTAQQVNDEVYSRRHAALARAYEADPKFSKLKTSLENEKFMDTVAVFCRKDGSEVFVVGNIKTRTSPTKSGKSTRYDYAPNGYGWSVDDEFAVVKTIRDTPELRNAKVKVIDLVEKPMNASQNAVRHAEMQFVAHCKRANINTQDYVGGISKPACTRCEPALAPFIRALSDGIPKDHAGADQVVSPEVVDGYSKRKLARFPVKDENWTQPEGVGETHKAISDKKAITHNFRKKELYAATKPNIRKGTITQPVQTLKRQNANTVKKNFKKHTGAHVNPGNTIENIIENYDRPKFAEAETLVHTKPHVYKGRSNIGAHASLHTARARAGESVADAMVEGPNVACGAHAGPGGVAAYANAELCRAEVSVPGVRAALGLNARTGVEIGPTGFGLDFLGFGFTFGPKCRFACPFGDLTFG